jgi:hypothetical protein
MSKIVDTAIEAGSRSVGLRVRYVLGCSLRLFGAAVAMAIKLIA